MMKQKVLFFDIDGTLLEMGKTEITPNMRKALCSLKQNGIKICIATGRPFVTIPMFEGIVFDAILAFNGSFCVAGDLFLLQLRKKLLQMEVIKI